MARGRLITIEGLDGAGKTTLATSLERALAARVGAVRVLREPGGVELAERVRALVKDPELRVGARAEALLYAAARAPTRCSPPAGRRSPTCCPIRRRSRPGAPGPTPRRRRSSSPARACAAPTPARRGCAPTRRRAPADRPGAGGRRGPGSPARS